MVSVRYSHNAYLTNHKEVVTVLVIVLYKNTVTWSWWGLILTLSNFCIKRSFWKFMCKNKKLSPTIREILIFFYKLIKRTFMTIFDFQVVILLLMVLQSGWIHDSIYLLQILWVFQTKEAHCVNKSMHLNREKYGWK